MSVTIPEGPICCCLGCRDTADVVIEHPDYGERPVCEDCAESFEVMGYV